MHVGTVRSAVCSLDTGLRSAAGRSLAALRLFLRCGISPLCGDGLFSRRRFSLARTARGYEARTACRSRTSSGTCPLETARRRVVPQKRTHAMQAQFPSLLLHHALQRHIDDQLEHPPNRSTRTQGASVPAVYCLLAAHTVTPPSASITSSL